jgi:hypothetical protein
MLCFTTAPPSGFYNKHKANFDKISLVLISLVLMHQGNNFMVATMGKVRCKNNPNVTIRAGGLIRGHRLWGIIGRLYATNISLAGVGEKYIGTAPGLAGFSLFA